MAASTIRDSMLSVVDTLRGLAPTFGIRRFAVTVRRRAWSTLVAGEGSATNYDIGITPAPKVIDVTSRDLTVLEAEMAAASKPSGVGNMYRITGITPQYTVNGVVAGGYLAEQLRLWPNRDTGAVENIVALVGDDGYLRECDQITFAQHRAFGYSMLVREVDRPRAALSSILVTSINQTLSLKSGTQLRFTANGTFQGGATSFLTTLCSWSSSNTGVATVDIYGNVTGISPGTTTLTASALGISGQATVTIN